MVAPVYMLNALPGKKRQEIFVTLRDCSQGGTVTLASGLTLAGGHPTTREKRLESLPGVFTRE